MGVAKLAEISKVMQRRLMLRFDAGLDSGDNGAVKTGSGRRKRDTASESPTARHVASPSGLNFTVKKGGVL